jgi:enoyl-[acyl-carrier protein] reductase II
VTVLGTQDGKGLRCEIRHDDLRSELGLLEEVVANVSAVDINFADECLAPTRGGTKHSDEARRDANTRMGLATVLRMRTRLTDLLDIEYPIMLAGMGGVSYHRLVAAVSEAGGIGTLGASTMSSAELPIEMAAVRELTSKPFGVDLLTALPGQVERGIQSVIDGGAKIFVAGLGVPREVIDLLHSKSILVGSMCGKVRHALSAVASGVDFVVAQGTEAGGHTGTVATIALVPQVVDAVGGQVPVVAAGGLFDGRGLAASLALGADGVWIGTRFIATPEARAVNGYKEALLATAEDGTVVSRSYTGKTCRVVRNEWTNHYDTHPDELQPFPAQAIASAKAGVNHLGSPDGTEVDATREFMPCGQGVGAIDSLVPAADVLRSMVAEAEETIERLMGARR